MHKLINRIILLSVVLLGGGYLLQDKMNSPEECQKIAGVWNESKATCEQTTAQVIYENLSAGYPITMNYPETDFKIELDKAETINETFFLRGHYQKELQKATNSEEAIYDRGSLYLNMSKMVVLNEETKGIVFYSAPFVINTAGSGVFVYIGLFSYDNNTKESVHLDSVLLGNRIREEKITYTKDYLQVDFKGHAKGQAFADYPSEDNVVFLQLQNHFSAFKIVKRMHSSWDQNGDGVNDCESDGSCDHTINYSLPRSE